MDRLPTRSMGIKIMYTFDQAHSVVCLARTVGSLDVPVMTSHDSNLGLVDLVKCLQAICRSSPEILSTDINDYAVYSKDISENTVQGVFVGHGFLSTLLLHNPDSQTKQTDQPTYIVGQVCRSVMPLYNCTETLEVHLRLSPVLKAQQSHYVDSLRHYKSLAGLEAPPPSKRSLTIADLEASVSRAKKQHTVPSYYSQYLASSPPRDTDSPNSFAENFLSSSKVRTLTTRTRPAATRQPTVNDREMESCTNTDTSETIESPMVNTPAGNTCRHNDHRSSDSTDSKTNEPKSDNLKSDDSQSKFSTDKSSDAGTPNSTKAPVKRARRQQYKIEERLVEALAEGKIPTYCKNCGCIRTATWRRFKSEEDDFTLCNPCGLWYSAKKTMRPKERWGRGRGRQLDSNNINSYLALKVAEANDETLTNHVSSLVTSTATMNPESEASSIPTSMSVSETTDNAENDMSRSPNQKVLQTADNTLHVPTATLPSHIELPGVQNKSDKQHEKWDESNKENIPPSPTQQHSCEIDALFQTPKKKTPQKSIDVTPASRWINKFIQQHNNKVTEEDDIFKAFMESPSRRYTDHFSDHMTSFDDDILNSEATHDTVPSSPPPSFYYQYEEITSSKRLASDHAYSL